jgi:lysyl-tRNA synthetase class 2
MSDDAAPEGVIATERVSRLAKLDRLRAAKVEPYPYRFDRTHSIAEVRKEFAELEPGEETSARVSVAGRLLLIRRQGKLLFATMRDRTGSIQLFVSKAVLGDEEFARFDDLDLGDWVGVEGTVMVTKKGELSVKVSSFVLLAKCLRPLPDKWKGLTDTDTRYRQRYVDLVVNDDARRIFEIRNATVASIRSTMVDRGFVEIEGPILQLDAGGAHARPFVTHHNALDLDMYLRIALELHLKRLIVGGLEKVFEIGRVFRNEGIGTRHNPEFTMMESYEAFADYTDVMTLTEEIVANAALAALGTTVIDINGRAVDLGRPFRRAKMTDLASEATGELVHPGRPLDELRDIALANGVKVEPEWRPGKIVEEIFEATAEASLIEPTFVTGHPVDVSPLARVDRGDPLLTERFELFIGGRELANAYSELNDPVVQRERFEDEQQANDHEDGGDARLKTIDEDYLRALEYGMPPTGGLGVGVDRLVMLLAGVASIKEVILFPTLRPEVP